MPEPSDTEHAPDLPVMEARQARRGRHALIILVVSLTLVIIALFGAYAFNAGPLAGLTGNTRAPETVSEDYAAPAPDAKQTPEENP